MTFVSQGSTSPRWDSRNQGFIPPSQLHQWKQQQERVHDFSPSPPPDRRPQPEPRPAVLRKNSAAPASPPSNTNHGHSRSFSAFSLFKARHPQENPPSPPPPADDDPVKSPRSPPPAFQENRSFTPDPEASAPQPAVNKAALSRLSSADAPTPPLHPEIRSIVQLTLAHAHKIYFSGPLVKRVERQPDGQKPTRDEGWRDVWAQLGGTTLSVWDMKAIEEASKQGKQVPPTYINVTDSFVNVLGSLTMSSTPGGPPTKFTNVITVNTAGSNLLLFACPSPQVLVSWASAFRLSAWEKSRLEEIYTAHLIRITLNDDPGRDAPSPLVNGKMEGWVRIRIAGQVDWKRMWMVVSVGSPTTPRRKKRISDLFVKERSPTRAAPPAKPIIHLVASPKPKDRKQPLLTMSAVTQAFAVYPERPELISRSTLMKLEGIFGEEELAGGMKLREGWLMVLPEFEGSNIRASEMLRWLIALHDTFELYGRPRQYSWDPRDPRSMMFAYPIGPQRDMLFLDRELAETLDVRDERTSTIRSQLQNILADRMRGTQEHSPIADKPPVLPPLPDASSEDLNANGKATRAEPPEQPKPREEFAMQLPPLDFSSEEPPTVPEKRVLTPITERSTSRDPSRSLSFEEPASKQLSSQVNSPPRIAEAAEEDNRVLGEAIVISPTATTPPPLPPIPIQERGRRNPSFEVFRPQPKAQRPELDRPASKSSLGYLSTAPQTPSMQAPTSTPGPEARPAASAQASPPPAKPPTSPPAPTSPVDRPAPTRSPGLPSIASHSSSTRPVSPQVPKSPSAPSRAPSSPVVPQAPQAPSPSSKSLPQVPPASSRASPAVSIPHAPLPAQPPTPPPHSASDDFSHAAGALLYMQQMQQEPVQDTAGQPNLPRSVNRQDDDRDYDSPSEYSQSYTSHQTPTSPINLRHTSPPSSFSDRPPASRRDTANSGTSSRSNMAGARNEITPAIAASPARSGMGRKPSGARAAPASKIPSRNSFAPDQSLQERDDDDEDMVDLHDAPPQVARAQQALEDPDADALAALTFLEQGEDADTNASQRRPSAPPYATSSSPSIPRVVEPADGSAKSSASREYRSSFAPSKQAAERKAKAQAQQALQQAAVSRPGRANGKARVSSRGAWAESSEEEDEEEEEEDDDADSDEDPAPRMPSGQQSASGSIAPSNSGSAANLSGRGPSPAAPETNGAYPQPRRPPRELPQVPGPGQPYPGMQGQQDEYLSPQPRRFMSDPYTGRQSMVADPPRQAPSPQSQLRPPTEAPHTTTHRQTMWSHALEAHNGTPPPSGPSRDTFIQMEPPSATMTKAFTPHGLLSAGIQDKQDRSAKRQEELARETGASLINVPNKPPPPQTGLLGAVTAHEREHKREGGIGAALTEREREKRLAEERQRKLDEYQRQQLEQMQQGGSMYGGMGMQGFNPMMGNPMMMGMNPMMTGAWGYPGMMPGFTSPQHMMAAQQAAMQAYQQAMMAFSTAGSQIGGDGGPAPLNPMMTGGSMGMGGMDPRMSMMGMPMMSPSMGMNPAMGMGMNSPMGSPMGGPMGMNAGMGMGMNPAMSPGMSPGMGGMDPRMSMMSMQMTGGGMSPPAFEGMHPVSENSGSGPNSSVGERRSPAPQGHDSSRGRTAAPSPLR